MPKQGEIDYVKKLPAEAVAHALGKPFSDPQCGQYFLNLGVVLSLLPALPARVLDLGVGTGWTSALLARRGYQVVGVDIAPDMIALAESHCASLPLRFMVADYESLDFCEEFDAVLFFDALHHAEDALEALAGAYRALKPDGICVAVEPGVGHAIASQPTVQRFGVTENDMPPRTIIELGKRIGFREFRVYQRPEVQPMLFEPAPNGALVRFAKAFARNMAKAFLGPGRQRRHWLENSHIVWMRK